MKRILVTVLLAVAVLAAAGGSALAGDPKGGTHISWER
jgi:hypothetical protein